MVACDAVFCGAHSSGGRGLDCALRKKCHHPLSVASGASGFPTDNKCFSQKGKQIFRHPPVLLTEGCVGFLIFLVTQHPLTCSGTQQGASSLKKDVTSAQSKKLQAVSTRTYVFSCASLVPSLCLVGRYNNSTDRKTLSVCECISAVQLCGSPGTGSVASQTDEMGGGYPHVGTRRGGTHDEEKTVLAQVQVQASDSRNFTVQLMLTPTPVVAQCKNRLSSTD